MRLGDLDELKEAINTYDTFACLPDGKLYPTRELKHPEIFVSYMYVEDVIKAIDSAPTTPLFVFRSRPKGQWIRKVDEVGFVSHICSKCGAEIEVEDPRDDKFCFNCGADMRGGAE